MNVIPAPLVKTMEEFDTQITHLSPYFSCFQVDIADGIFVPNTTITLNDLEQFITKIHPPYLANISFDFHLMVNDYENAIKQIDELSKQITVSHVFIHAALHPEEKIWVENNKPFTIGLVLNPEEDIQGLRLSYNLEKIPFLQVMSVHPGFQGQSFLPESLQQIEQIREGGYRSSIYMDGGINHDSIPLIKQAPYPPDFLCIGSYLTHADNIEERVKELEMLIK